MLQPASSALVCRLATLAQLTQTMFDAMEFGFLFDPTRQLFSIGYRVTEAVWTRSCYDLLASEARLAELHRHRQGRCPSVALVQPRPRVDARSGWGSALISWSGSMFEYLMPELVMRAPAGSLLRPDAPPRRAAADAIWRRARRAVGHFGVGLQLRGISELTYQYSNFGVPGLGLKRGLSEDVVVAPYATALAAMIDPRAAAQNFARLAEAGGQRPLRLVRGARLHGRPGCPRAKASRWCAPIWRITRA